MENETENVEFQSKGQQREMTDTAFASDLLKEAFEPPAGKVKVALDRACKAIFEYEKALPEHVKNDKTRRRWTARRVRALWFQEARRIDNYEIDDLTAVAVEEAKIARQRAKVRDQRLAALIAASRTGHRSQMDQR